MICMGDLWKLRKCIGLLVSVVNYLLYGLMHFCAGFGRRQNPLRLRQSDDIIEDAVKAVPDIYVFVEMSEIPVSEFRAVCDLL